MLYILIILIVGIIFVNKTKNNYITHIFLSVLMYGLYIYLWFIPSIMDKTYHNINKPHVDSALGVAIVFIFSMPVYLLIHAFFIWYAKKNKLKKILIIHWTGIVLLMIQLVIFLYKVNLFR